MKTKENRPSAATLRRRVETGACGWLTPFGSNFSRLLDQRQHRVRGGA